MDKCFEYFLCEKKECPAYGTKMRVECWKIENTLCNDKSIEVILYHNHDKCKYCQYYKAVNFTEQYIK